MAWTIHEGHGILLSARAECCIWTHIGINNIYTMEFKFVHFFFFLAILSDVQYQVESDQNRLLDHKRRT